jgi:hypothetical protein
VAFKVADGQPPPALTTGSAAGGAR